MLRSNPTSRLAATMAAVVALAAPLAACDSEKQAEKPKTTAASATLCGVQLSASAKNAVLDLVGGKEIKSNGSEDSLADTARALVSGYRVNGADDYEEYPLCTAYGPVATVGADLSFYLSEEVPTSVSPKFTQYDMGELALARPSHAVMYMECSSSKFSSGSKPVLVEGDLTNAQVLSSDDAKVREENLNVLHAVSLAMVRELGCEGDAGLPQKFSPPSEA
ncbi:hypothetical protein [Streptomyces sp. KR55]|uniref:hypothetical protein n=1 Tax=Streptomyces sp. KR55 TaxID=3457425 RepID=UPI003FD4658B